MKLFSSPKGFNSRLEQAEEMISELEDKAIEIIQFEEQINKMDKSKQNLRDLWDTIKHTNIYLIVVPEEEKRKGQQNIEDIMAENIQNLMKNVHLFPLPKKEKKKKSKWDKHSH